MSESKCIDVCYKVLKMMLDAGEDYHGLCDKDTSGVNHNEFEKRLDKYILISKKRDIDALLKIKEKAYEACSTGDQKAELECIELCDSFDCPI